ncbi:MAG: hypothetical protein CM1200mP3_03990 [Chloroflexota bacterium]|nr:MAG: hypothetical protein CM1200mP3_03990 [Chloroflexota bacterium]
MLQNPENVIPYVVERDPRGERTYDIYSLLLKERIVFLGTGINDQVANAIIAQLFFPWTGKTRSEISTCTSILPVA